MGFEAAKINKKQHLRGPLSVLPLGYVCSQGSQDPSSVCALEIKVKLGVEAKTFPLVSTSAIRPPLWFGKVYTWWETVFWIPQVSIVGGRGRRGSHSNIRDALGSSSLSTLSRQLSVTLQCGASTKLRCWNQPLKKTPKSCSADDQCHQWPLQPHLKLWCLI